MNVDTAKIKKIVDDFSYEKTGKHINDMLGTAAAKGVKNVVIDMERNTESTDNIECEYNQDELVLLVPDELKKQIALSIEYFVSRLDKIEEAFSDIERSLDNDRFAKIRSAKFEVENIDAMKDLSHMYDVRTNLDEAIQSLWSGIKDLVMDVNNIPKERRKRVFKTKIKKILKDVQNGRVKVKMLVIGLEVYAEISLRLDEKQVAERKLNEYIENLKNIYGNGEFERVEQWNEKMDKYWEDGIKNEIIKLESYITEIEQQNKKIAIN